MGQLNENLANIENLTYQGNPIDENNKIEAIELNKGIIVVVDNYDVKINGNGTVSVEGKNEVEETTHITASVIAKNPEKYYGQYILEPNTLDSAGMRILFADDNNIYIIQNYNCWREVTYDESQYSGLDDITDPKLQELNRKLFESRDTNVSFENDMKEIAFMMDTDYWNNLYGFKSQEELNATKVEFVIGAPTIEMLLNSYNQKHGTNYQTHIINKKDNETEYLGYEFRKTDNENWVTAYEMFDPTDKMYSNFTLNNAYQLASPSPYFDSKFFCWGGWIDEPNTGTQAYRSYYRPVMCLKADVELEKVGNEDSPHPYFMIKE